jgi:hypothetical protein
VIETLKKLAHHCPTIIILVQDGFHLVEEIGVDHVDYALPFFILALAMFILSMVNLELV